MNKKTLFCFFLFFFFFSIFNGKLVKASEENVNLYDGKLGYSYSNSSTTFMIWSSSASEIEVVVEGKEIKPMIKEANNNTWIATVGGDLSGYEYSFNIKYLDGTIYENVLDPYGKYLNSTKTKNMIFNDSYIYLEDWDKIDDLLINDQNKIIYGLDLDTFTTHNTWYGNSLNQGKLLSLNQSSTSYNNFSTGFDHIKSLGVTYVQIPKLIDEVSPFVVNNKYVSGENGYSGSYELRSVVDSYYKSNIGIILEFDFDNLDNGFSEILLKTDKNYYVVRDGKLDLSKRMSQRYIKDIVNYWVETYNLSGIKFKNMSMFDYDLINEVSSSLKKINKNILIYGNGSYSTKNENAAGENNLSKLDGVAMLNNSFNYAMFGELNDKDTQGILSGVYSPEMIESLKFTLLSTVDNGQIDYSLVKGISYKSYWGNDNSFEIVNALGSSEGLSVYDKLLINNLTGNDLIERKMVLAFGTLMMSGGIPYIEAGNEFLASFQNFDDSSDSICTENLNFCFYSVNSRKLIDWSFVYDKKDMVNNFRSLVNFRKRDNEVIQSNSEEISKRVKIYTGEAGNIGYIRNYPNAYVDETQNVLVLFNYSNSDYIIDDYTEKGWKGLYNYNLSNRDGDNINMKQNSIYISKQVRPPVVGQWVLLLIVVGIISLLYGINIYLNKKLVEKRGYDINQINKKYRPFINKNKIKKEEPIDDLSTIEENKEDKKE